MSSPGVGGRSRLLRVAGLALLGVAAGALLVGLITLGVLRGGGDGGNAAPTPTGQTTGGATGAPGTTTGSPGSPAPGTGTSVPPATTQAPPAATATPAPAPPPEATVHIRVYNNSRIAKLAQQAADDFRRFRWTVDAVSNYPETAGRLETSTVYFRPGTEEEAAARQLGQRFNLRVEPRSSQPGIERIAGSGPGLIVVVTNDYGSK